MAAQPQDNMTGLKALVGILGVLVVLGTALVVGIVIHRLYAKPASPSITPPAPDRPGPIGNRLPAGESIKSIAPAGPDLAIWVTGPQGERVLLYNPGTGQLTLAVSADR